MDRLQSHRLNPLQLLSEAGAVAVRLARICVCSSCARGGNDEAHHPSAQGKQSAKGVRATAAANSQSRMMVSRVTLWLNAAQVDTFGSADPYVCVSALDPSQTKVIHDHKAIEVEPPVKQPACLSVTPVAAPVRMHIGSSLAFQDIITRTARKDVIASTAGKRKSNSAINCYIILRC